MADIVIAPFTVSKKCSAARVIVDRRMLRGAARMPSISRVSRSAPCRWRASGGTAHGCLSMSWSEERHSWRRTTSEMTLRPTAPVGASAAIPKIECRPNTAG